MNFVYFQILYRWNQTIYILLLKIFLSLKFEVGIQTILKFVVMPFMSFTCILSISYFSLNFLKKTLRC